jgi:hypothetical protein
LILTIFPATFSGFVDGAFTRDGGTLSLAQVQWSRAVSKERPLGYTLALVGGENGDAVHALEAEGFRHVYQASLAYRLPNGVTLEAGVYPSHIGMESFYSKDDWNYTRGWLAELSPYYQAGVKASYALDEHWSVQLHLLNGWQTIRAGEHGRVAGTQLAYTRGSVSASFNTYVDRERTFGDLLVLWRVHPRLQLGTSVDAGSQGEADWTGAGVYARYTVDARQALAVRIEEFRDPRNGISGASQTLREATLTYELRPGPHLILKVETRRERARFSPVASAVVTF